MYSDSLGLPERDRKPNVRIGGCFLPILIACVLLAFAGVIYGLYKASQPRPTLPIVVITEPKPGDSVTTNDTVTVFAHAQDPDRIARAELWVNGQLVATQGSREPQGTTPLYFNQSWRPTQAAAYSVEVRAVDTLGFVGQSKLLVLEVVEKNPQHDPNATAQVFDDAGQSSLIPLPPDENNPDDSPPPGVQVPGAPPPGVQPPGAPPGGGENQVPSVEPPPVELLPPDVDASDQNEGFRLPPNWRDWLCVLPGTCGPNPGDRPPGAPSNVAADNEECEVEVRWSYSADDVVGFYLYRTPAGVPLPLPSLVEIIQPHQSGNERKGYSPRIRETTGRYRYMVGAFNAAGVTYSASSEIVEISQHCQSPSANVAVEFELLDIDMQGQQYDTVYCYASVAGSPFEQVREITQQAQSTRKIRIQVPGNAPWQVAARCLAWRGAELIFLGDILRSHQCPCIGDHEYTVSPANGGFEVRYRIGAADLQWMSGEWGNPDASIPRPQNLRQAARWYPCNLPLGNLSCGGSGVEAPSLEWDYAWPLLQGDPGQVSVFRVYRRLPGQTEPEWIKDNGAGSESAPLLDCYDEAWYSVSAGIEDEHWGGPRESEKSQELLVTRNCVRAVVQVKLLRLYANALHDRDAAPSQDVESYGWIKVRMTNPEGWEREVVLTWNEHHDGSYAGPIYGDPDHTNILERSSYSWSSMYLNHSKDNNTVSIPVYSQQNSLRISWRFQDHDGGFWNPDDEWCVADTELLGREVTDWSRINLTFDGGLSPGHGVPIAGRGEDGSCSITVEVKGSAP